MPALGWKLVYDGRTPPLGAVVRPGERLSSLRMAGLGAAILTGNVETPEGEILTQREDDGPAPPDQRPGGPSS